MVFFYVSFTIKEEDSDLALFKCILFMYPDDLSIQIEPYKVGWKSMISSQSHGSVYDRVIGKGIRHDHSLLYLLYFYVFLFSIIEQLFAI